MCKMNANEVMASFNEIMIQARKGEQNAKVVANKLRDKAAMLRNEANELIALARVLDGSLSEGENPRSKVIVLKEGERHPKAPKAGRKPKAKSKSKAYHKPTQAEIDAMSPERREKYLANVERCRKMREAKQKNALVEKFAQTKIS